MDDSGDLPATEVDITATEKLILQWDPIASPARSSSSDNMLSDGADCDQASRFLRVSMRSATSSTPTPPTPSAPRVSFH
ncbi:polycomb group protein EMBRYONIC FLOWER 2 isoform X2 [Iris pallida]|uniref:Polycomb group protein EMBRYONIC FLOWER 2 isoform X2 n=1 Tax=Iris pallida TaxID=29817 RepID=A0AAX6HK28_IRIPA|nr:polycomb group protein EMBRYONIC FLOWER 2 isoform X2 [Iris pallida]KAJ6841396.1 polycomb group protein EMBRYONIC FLOWER 2 isoform X2 [Iris pallida]